MDANNVLLQVNKFVGCDCEKFITTVFANMEMQTHLVYKLTGYCNKYNTKKIDKNKFNFNGCIDFICSLDSTNLYRFNQFFK